MNRDIEARLKISAIDKTGKVLANVGRKMEDLSLRARAFNRVNEGVRDQLLLLGKIAGPAAVGLELYRATKAAANFETSLFNIQKKSNATSDQMQQLAQDIRDLSKQMPLSREDIALGMERGAAAGISLDKLKDFARLTAMIADGWDVTSEEAGNFVAGFNKGLHIPMEQMEQFASLINDLADSGIADEKDVAEFIDRVGASLQNFGMSPNEVAAYGAAMLNLKMPAEVAARAMDTLSGKLLAPENLGKKSKSALKSIVGDMKAFAKLSGNDKLNLFMTNLSKMTNQRRASLLGALLGEGFDDEIMRVVAGFDEVKRNLDMAHKEALNPSHSITTLYEMQLKTFNKQLDMFKNKLIDIELSLGNRILPLANKALTSVSKALDDMDASDRGQNIMGFNTDKADYWKQADDFIDKFNAAGISEDMHDATAAWNDFLTALGNDKVKSPEEYLQQRINKAFTDAGGNLSGGPKHRFSAGYLPSDWLGASPSQYSLDNPPMPSARPSEQEMRDIQTALAYAQAGSMGRENMGSAIAWMNDRQKELAKRAPDYGFVGFTHDQDSMFARHRALMAADARARTQAARDDELPRRRPTLGEALKMDMDYGGSLDYHWSSQKGAPDLKKNGILSALFDPSGQNQASGISLSEIMEKGGDTFHSAVEKAATAILQACQQGAAALSNIKVPTAAPQAQVDRNLGKNNTFVRPATLGHQ